MKIFNRGILGAFWVKHPSCKGALSLWYHDVSQANWKKPSDVTKAYSKARTVKNNRAVFEINGKDYRLIVEINYQKGWVNIVFLGSHAEYDKVDATNIDLYKKQR